MSPRTQPSVRALTASAPRTLDELPLPALDILREPTWEQLPATVTCYSYREEVPGDKERAEAEYFALNRRMEAKGFGRFTMNQVLRTDEELG